MVEWYDLFILSAMPSNKIGQDSAYFRRCILKKPAKIRNDIFVQIFHLPLMLWSVWFATNKLESVSCTQIFNKLIHKFFGQVENSDISDFSDQIVRVFQVRVFLLALCSNLKTRTSRIKFLLCTRRKLGHVGT